MDDQHCQACLSIGVDEPTDIGLSGLPLCTAHAREWHQFALAYRPLFNWANQFRHAATQAQQDRVEMQREWAKREAQFKADRATFEATLATLQARQLPLLPLLARAQALLSAAGELLQGGTDAP